MALVAAPGNGIAFRINHSDGSIVPCDPSNGPASLGMMTITVTNFGTELRQARHRRKGEPWTPRRRDSARSESSLAARTG